MTACRPFYLLSAILLSLPALAQITLSAPAANVPVDDRLELTAAGGQGDPATWTWSVDEPLRNALGPVAGHPERRWFRAPYVLAPRTYTIRVTDGSGASATQVLRVEPAPARSYDRKDVALGIVDVHLKHMGWPTWHLPHLTLFASPPRPLETDPAHAFGDLHSLAAIDDPLLGPLDGHWVACGGRKLWILDGSGKARVLPLQGRPGFEAPTCTAEHFPRLEIRSIAVRPPGSPRDPGRRLVFLATSEAWGRKFNIVCEVDGDGRVSPVAGLRLHRDDPAEWKWQASGDASTMGMPAVDGALAMDRRGVIYLASAMGWIQRIGLGGKVSLLAGRHPRLEPGQITVGSVLHNLFGPPRDAVGPEATFGHIASMTLDPETGDLYVVDRDCIRRVTPEGAVSTVLGNALRQGFEPFPGHAPGAPVPPLAPCLNHPAGLAFQRGLLFICDRGNHAIRAFDPRTRGLWNVLGGPHQAHTRLGPLGFFDASLPPGAAAAIRLPDLVAARGNDILVATEAWQRPEGWGEDTAILRFSLTDDVFPQPAPPGDSRERKDPAPPAAGR